MKKLVSIVLFAFAGTAAWAQDQPQDLEVQYNPNSLNPIPLYEQLYKVRVWRNVDLREKQNKGFFARNGEISKLIVDAVKSGELVDVYATDSLAQKVAKEDFLGRLTAQAAVTYPQWNPTQDFYTDDVVEFNGKTYRATQDSKGVPPVGDATKGTGRNQQKLLSTDYWEATTVGAGVEYLVSDMTLLHMVEDVIFDRRRSRLYYDIQAVEVLIPGAKTQTGIDVSLGWFKYKDLEKLFRNNIPKAVWFNPQNTAQNKNFADAFLLRLFHGTIYKVQNPDDETIDDTYRANGRPYQEGVWAREWTEIMLMEKEHNLWEF
jgi:gliding motility associated protien GldN